MLNKSVVRTLNFEQFYRDAESMRRAYLTKKVENAHLIMATEMKGILFDEKDLIEAHLRNDAIELGKLIINAIHNIFDSFKNDHSLFDFSVAKNLGANATTFIRTLLEGEIAPKQKDCVVKLLIFNFLAAIK